MPLVAWRCDIMESRDLFTAIFVKYANEEDISNSKTHFKEVRTRFGGVVKEELTFNKDNSSTILCVITEL